MPQHTSAAATFTPTPKVMISSTARDLPEHRTTALSALGRLQFVPIAMEHGTAASDSSAIIASLQMVEQADIYVGIFGKRYGSMPADPMRNPEGLSVTELEYRHAKQLGKPVFVFIAHDDHLFTGNQMETNPEGLNKLNAFTGMLRKELAGIFEDAKHLETLIYQALEKYKPEYNSAPASDSQFNLSKNRIPPLPTLWAVPAYGLTNKFIGRSAELAQLDAWAASPTAIMVVEGIGGLGKSALTWQWFNDNAEAVFIKQSKPLRGRLWWSFYENTSLKEFTRYALAYLCQIPVEQVGKIYRENALQLSSVLQQQACVLVFDGFERMLHAYRQWNIAQQRDENFNNAPEHKRRCIDPDDAFLLNQLTQVSESKILISSRLFPAELEDSIDKSPLPNVAKLSLEGLAEWDVIDFMSVYKVTGNRQSLLRFVNRFERHSLIVKLICGMVNQYLPAPGNFDAWLADPNYGGKLRLSDLDLQQRKNHILAFAMEGLSDTTLQVLQRVALLSEDVDYATLSVVNPFKHREVEGSSKVSPKASSQHKRATTAQPEVAFNSALTELIERGLLQREAVTNRFNMHPVVRATAADTVDATNKKSTFRLLRNHFSALPEDNTEEATSLDDVQTSLNLYRCLLEEGLHQRALDLYHTKLDTVIRLRLCNYKLVIELLSPLVKEKRQEKPLLEKINRAKHNQEKTNREINSREASNRPIAHHSGAQQVDLVFSKIRYAPTKAWALEALGSAYEKTGEITKAQNYLERAIELDIQQQDITGLINRLAVLCNMYGVIWQQNALAVQYGIAQWQVRLGECIADQKWNNYAKSILFDSLIQIGNVEQAARIEAELLESHLKQDTGFLFWRWYYRFVQNKAKSAEVTEVNHLLWQQGFEAAKKQHYVLWQEQFLRWKSVEQMVQQQHSQALQSINAAFELMNQMGAYYTGNIAIRAWVLAENDLHHEARRMLSMLGDSELGYSVLYFRGKALQSLGNIAVAKQAALYAYKQAWGIGAPYSNALILPRAKALLQELGEPIPDMPPFDESMLPKIPFEDEIRTLIEEHKAKPL